MQRIIDVLTFVLVAPFRPRADAVLRALNEARISLGRPPLESLPRGKRGRAHACPLAECLPGVVGRDAICFMDETQARKVARAWKTDVDVRSETRYLVALPRVLRRFVGDFDLGAFRQLGETAADDRRSLALDPPGVERPVAGRSGSALEAA